MKAIRITGQGGPEVLALAEVAEPAPGPEELLVEVKATALNRADLLQCLGMYPAPFGAPADIPGLEYAGVVRAAGPRVRRFKVGDRVMGIVAGGGFAERLTTHEREAVAIPSRLGFGEAAAIPEAFFTAFDALVLQGRLRPGEAVLVHAAGSGVGTAATQLVTAFGAIALGTARTEAKLAVCQRDHGLRHGIRVEGDPPRFAEQVRALTGGRGVDLVIDLVGGSYLSETLDACAPRARSLLVGVLGGAATEIELRKVLQKRVMLLGTVLRSRAIEEKIEVAQAFSREVLPLFEAGKLHPVVDQVLPASEVQRGFERMASNQSLGKLVLEWR